MIPGNGSAWDTIKFLLTLPVALVTQAVYIVHDWLKGHTHD